MAIKERSVGPLYFARLRTVPSVVPPHMVGIVQMEAPWREGRALVLHCFGLKALVVGLWFKAERDVEEGFEDAQWLSPHTLANVTAHEISEWSDGEAAPEEEQLQGSEL